MSRPDSIGPVPLDHPPILPDRLGILLINLGTPDATDYWSMRRYLREFLSDPRVIETNRVLWWFVLNLIILSVRPNRSGAAYKRIWNTELDESPLRTITRSQASNMADRLASDRVVVDWAMRYGNPSIASRLRALEQQGCHRIILFPLYPQYSASTTATACDAAFASLRTMRWQPSVRVVPPYYQDEGYIDALAQSVTSHLGQLDWEPEVVLASFHGLPRSYLENGDPYHCQCAKTARLVRERLGWSEDRFRLTFQSRFGPAEWLKPYTDETLTELGQAGVKRVAVIAPGFSADCVETLEELADENRETFLEAGGERYSYIPCLNDDARHMTVLADVVRREAAGWIVDG